MGNNSQRQVEKQTSSNPFFTSDSKKDSQLGQLLHQFSFVSTYEDDLFKRCSIIEHRQTKQLIVTKQIACENEAEMDRIYEEFERRKAALIDANLLRLRYVIKKKTEGIFSDDYKLILFFDYVVTNLLVQYGNRIKKQNYFTPQEINIILCGTIRGYAALEKQKISNSKVRLRNIYFGLQDGLPLPKVLDSKLFPDETNTVHIKNGQHNSDIFLAPQELKSIHNGSKYNNQKSGVFSLGISLVQLCLLTPCQDVYNYNKMSLNYNQLDNRLNIVKNKYPLSVYYIIRELLERNDQNRPSFSKLAENLPSNLKNLPQTMNISVMKGTTNTMRGSSKVLSPTGYSKIISPVAISKEDRRMHSTNLVSEYRPNLDTTEMYTNGNMYLGQKKDGYRHGKGKYSYADGSYYYGDWIKGKMQGSGKLYDQNNNLVYEGDWKDDHYEGKGKIMGFDTDWYKYEGEFRNGKMEGFGEMFFNDGKKYKGEFRNNVPWGKGRMFGKNQQVQNGIWDNGDFISEF